MSAGDTATDPLFFATPESLRRWLLEHHESRSELWVGLHKKASGKPSITWPELVDELLRVGWIDGIRKSLDETSYVIRVTPRTPRSNWSEVNLRRMAELVEAGDVEPAGLAAYEARDEARTKRYSFERENVALDPAFEAELRGNPKAWRYFESESPSYRKTVTWWVMSAKRDATRRRRFETLLRDSEEGQRIGPMRR